MDWCKLLNQWSSCCLSRCKHRSLPALVSQRCIIILLYMAILQVCLYSIHLSHHSSSVIITKTSHSISTPHLLLSLFTIVSRSNIKELLSKCCGVCYIRILGISANKDQSQVISLYSISYSQARSTSRSPSSSSRLIQTNDSGILHCTWDWPRDFAAHSLPSQVYLKMPLCSSSTTMYLPCPLSLFPSLSPSLLFFFSLFFHLVLTVNSI